VIALVAATLREARPLIDGLAAVERPDAVFRTWQTRTKMGDRRQQVRLLVSGVGKVAAAAATASLICQHKVDRLINFGACGALMNRGEFRPGTLCQVIRVVEGDHLGMGERPADPVACHPVKTAGLPLVDLVTIDRPLFDPERRSRLAALGQVVDMEGGAVARTAAWFGVPCTLIKGITDPAGDGDRDLLRANLDRVSAALAQKVLELLHQFDS
jgi:adenosylhomocysteine nucleosidase